MPSWDWTPTEPPPCPKRSQVSAPQCERSHSPTLGWAAPGSSRPPLLSSRARCTEAGEGQRLDWAVPGHGATVPPLTTATGSDSEAGVAGERLTPDTPGKAPTPGEGTADGLPGSRQRPGAWGSGGQMRPQGCGRPPGSQVWASTRHPMHTRTLCSGAQPGAAAALVPSTHTCARACNADTACTHVRAHACTHTACTCVHANTCARVCARTCTHACMGVCVHACAHTCMNTCACSHAHDTHTRMRMGTGKLREHLRGCLDAPG